MSLLSDIGSMAGSLLGGGKSKKDKEKKLKKQAKKLEKRQAELATKQEKLNNLNSKLSLVKKSYTEMNKKKKYTFYATIAIFSVSVILIGYNFIKRG